MEEKEETGSMEPFVTTSHEITFENVEFSYGQVEQMCIRDRSYIDAMNAAAPSWLLVVIVLGTLLIAAFSAWVGCRMLKKQFEKAGITR